VLDYGRTTYHPPAGLADHIRARDQHCRFPLCRRRAADAELDHIVAWAEDGETTDANLHALCRRHHTLEHHTGWRIEAHPDGPLTWITPTGHPAHHRTPRPPAGQPRAATARSAPAISAPAISAPAISATATAGRPGAT
jgi:HNH endonuclease